MSQIESSMMFIYQKYMLLHHFILPIHNKYWRGLLVCFILCSRILFGYRNVWSFSSIATLQLRFRIYFIYPLVKPYFFLIYLNAGGIFDYWCLHYPNKDNLLHMGCDITEICNLNRFYLDKYIKLEFK